MTPRQVEEVEIGMLQLMLDRASELRIEKAKLAAIAAHNPAELDNLNKESVPPDPAAMDDAFAAAAIALIGPPPNGNP